MWDAARGLQNWLSEGTGGSVLEAGVTSVFGWQAGLLGSHLFSETTLRGILNRAGFPALPGISGLHMLSQPLY